jgi:hypothetical protein
VVRCCWRACGNHWEGDRQGGGGGLTEGGGVMTGQRGRHVKMAFWWRAAPVIIDECGEVLRLEGDKGVRQWRLLEETGGSRRRSPTNGKQRRGSSVIPCRLVSSSRRRWIRGGKECRVSSCGRGRGEKSGEKEGGRGGGGDRFKSAR